MNLQRIFLISGLVLSIYILPAFVNNVHAGITPCDHERCQDSKSECETINVCCVGGEPCEPEIGCFWTGSKCEDPTTTPTPTPTPPGNCTVSVDSGSIDDSLVCICQAQTKKGKDTFKVVECGNTDEEEDCARRQGEVKRYIDADPNSSSNQGLILDCSEINCNDFCS